MSASSENSHLSYKLVFFALLPAFLSPLSAGLGVVERSLPVDSTGETQSGDGQAFRPGKRKWGVILISSG